jgi:hypothetical protein
MSLAQMFKIWDVKGQIEGLIMEIELPRRDSLPFPMKKQMHFFI